MCCLQRKDNDGVIDNLKVNIFTLERHAIDSFRVILVLRPRILGENLFQTLDVSIGKGMLLSQSFFDVIAQFHL